MRKYTFQIVTPSGEKSAVTQFASKPHTAYHYLVEWLDNKGLVAEGLIIRLVSDARHKHTWVKDTMSYYGNRDKCTECHSNRKTPIKESLQVQR